MGFVLRRNNVSIISREKATNYRWEILPIRRCYERKVEERMTITKNRHQPKAHSTNIQVDPPLKHKTSKGEGEDKMKGIWLRGEI